MIYPNLVTVGSINSGATLIQIDVANGIGSDVPVKVLLSADYLLAAVRPPGMPTRPSMTGATTANLDAPGRTISSGSTISVLKCEATALVAAGAGTLA